MLNSHGHSVLEMIDTFTTAADRWSRCKGNKVVFSSSSLPRDCFGEPHIPGPVAGRLPSNCKKQRAAFHFCRSTESGNLETKTPLKIMVPHARTRPWNQWATLREAGVAGSPPARWRFLNHSRKSIHRHSSPKHTQKNIPFDNSVKWIEEQMKAITSFSSQCCRPRSTLPYVPVQSNNPNVLFESETPANLKSDFTSVYIL